MRKIMIGLLLIMFCLSTAGCPAQTPVQEPAPKPLVVPETSKVGFSPVDLNNAPDVIKNIASDISKREQATWVKVNGTNYLLLSAGEKATSSRVEITDITQKIPAQDFVWLDVKAKYNSVKEGNQSNPVTAVSLNLTSDRTINGVGFEITKTAAATSTTPTPATPAPSTTTPATPAPKTPTPAAPTPTPTPTPSKTTPETPAKETTPAEKKVERQE
ncbi:MAG: hypothetical protein PHT62_03600 [Desulfotomaculaceae bacterium]|nr:hypothetical protein [Desulfotomaculaceae bacterium]